MSVFGGNAVRGSTLATYRPTTSPSTGGQTSTSWTATLTGVKWELHTLKADTIREVFGAVSDVDLVAFSEANANVLPKDGVVVSAGTYTGSRYRVTHTRRSRRYLEIGLQSTTEVIP